MKHMAIKVGLTFAAGLSLSVVVLGLLNYHSEAASAGANIDSQAQEMMLDTVPTPPPDATGGPPPIAPGIWAGSGYEHTPSGNIIVHLQDHEPGPYDIYLEDNGATAYRICEDVVTDAGGSTNPDPTCSLAAVNPPPGIYDLYSTAAATTSPRVATAVEQVQVIAASNPSIIVAGGNFWAANETTELILLDHPVISGTSYDVKLFDGAGVEVTPPIAINHSGLMTDSIDWTVPDLEAIGLTGCPMIGTAVCRINSFINGTTTAVATTTVRINQPLILMSAPSNGIAYVRGEAVYISLKAHTPSRRYDIQLPNSPLFPTNDTNAVGDTVSPIIWIIPEICGFGSGLPNGTYTASSSPLGPDATIIASTIFDVFTPSDPTLTVDGGTTWAAGSTINIRVLRHLENAEYYLEFDDARIPTAAVDDTFLTDGCGEAVINYTIPLTQAGGTYPIASFNMTNTQQSTLDVVVQASTSPSEMVYLPIILKQ